MRALGILKLGLEILYSGNVRTESEGCCVVRYVVL
jgi:hypothetical protein